MPSRRYEWHEHIVEVWGEHCSARAAIARLRRDYASTPDILDDDSVAAKFLRKAQEKLEGTYIVRLFAAFESALRSYDQSRYNDPDRRVDASTLIDVIAGRYGRGIHHEIRQAGHRVRRVRNHWAHESDEDPEPMTIDEARSRLQAFLAELPDRWG